MKFEKYEIATKRLANITMVSNYSELLYNNIIGEHFEKYNKNEKKWMTFLAESIRLNELILPVLLFGNCNAYEGIKEIYDNIVNKEIDLSKISIKEIHILNCYSRLMCLCDTMKELGDFSKMREEILRYKKRAFYSLKVGDIIYTKVERNIGEKCGKYTIRRRFEEWIKSKVISVESQKEKIQVEYRKRWYKISDYPKNIITNKDIFMSNKDIWNIEHGKDNLFNLLNKNI